MDRRAIFFLGAAVVCALLAPVADPDNRWVPVVLSITYALLAIASYLDFRSRHSASAAGTSETPAPQTPERVLTQIGG